MASDVVIVACILSIYFHREVGALLHVLEVNQFGVSFVCLEEDCLISAWVFHFDLFGPFVLFVWVATSSRSVVRG